MFEILEFRTQEELLGIVGDEYKGRFPNLYGPANGKAHEDGLEEFRVLYCSSVAKLLFQIPATLSAT